MGFRLASAANLHDLLRNGTLNAPTRHGPKPTIRPELMELLLEFVETNDAP
jgi:hypothetical protein